MRTIRECRIKQLVIAIERQGGDSGDFAERFLHAMVQQSPPEGQRAMANLVTEVDALRRARRTYRQFFARFVPKVIDPHSL